MSVLFQRAKKDVFRQPFAICPRGSLPARAIKWAQFINCSHNMMVSTELAAGVALWLYQAVRLPSCQVPGT